MELRAEIGIIGGTSLKTLLEDATETKIYTPYGAPSDSIFLGEIEGRSVAFIPRHGRNHTIPPHKINYRANIWALKSLRVRRIIAVFAVGSLKEEIKPGDVVIPDQFMDFTWGRPNTFYEGGMIAHISVADPFCPELRKVFASVAGEFATVHENGTYVCINGPRFSTRAESRFFRQFADIIGMTLCPEAVLAREAGICYVPICLVTDYDVWAEKPVSAEEVRRVARQNEEKVKKILLKGIPKIPRVRNCECAEFIKEALM